MCWDTVPVSFAYHFPQICGTATVFAQESREMWHCHRFRAWCSRGGARYDAPMERIAVTHTIPPVFDTTSRVLILGSFPSPKSREVGFFYGHPQNRMWCVLARVLGEETVPQSTLERTAFLLRHHIAMWDTIESCTIVGASDSSIRDVVPNDLSRILSVAPIRTVFTTGAKASLYYKRYQLPMTGMPAHQLPSTSGANAAWSLERLVSSYQVIADVWTQP